MRAGRSFLLPAVIVVGTFAAVRVPYLWGHPVPGLQGDTTGYFTPIGQMLSGQWPTFEVRTPGYPFVLFVVSRLAHDSLALLVLQFLASLAGQLWLLSGVHTLRPSLTLGAAAAIAVAKASQVEFNADSSIMADSLYASGLLVAAGFMLRLFAHPVRGRDAIGTSLAVGAAILLRPAGLFLLGTWLLLLSLMVRRGATRSALASLALPLPAVLLGLCSYNLATVGDFSISPWGTANILGATSCYWQTSPSYPADVNEKVAAMQSRLTPVERETLDRSWSLPDLAHVYSVHFNDFLGMGLVVGYHDDARRQVLSQVAFDAIQARPDLYAKFVASQFALFLEQFSRNTWDQYEAAIGKKAYILLPGSERRRVVKQHLRLPDVRMLPDLAVASPLETWQDIRVRPPVAVRILTHVYGFFRARPWIWIWWLALAAGAWRLLRSGGRDPGAGVIVALGTLHLGAGVLVSLVEIGEPRYSSPTEFAVYLPLALIPLLWSRPETEHPSPAAEDPSLVSAANGTAASPSAGHGLR